MMLKIPLLLLTTVLISIPCLGQSPTIQWQRCLGGNYAEQGFAIRPTVEGGSILVSTGRSTGGDLAGSGYHQWIDQWGFPSSDFWVVKLGASGSIQWQKCFGSFGNETPWDVRSTADGGYIVVGSTTSNGGNVSGYRGGESDVWLVKLSAAGTLQWQRCLGGTNSDFGYGVEQVQDGGYIVSGSTRSNDGDILGNNGNGDIWVVRLNELGIPLWQSCLGGSGAEYSRGIRQTQDGGFIVAGATGSSNGDVVGFHGGDYDAWVVKLDSLGAIAWQKCLGGSNNDGASSIAFANDGGFIFAGSTYSLDGDIHGHNGQLDAWVVRLSATGDTLWTKCLGGALLDVGMSIVQVVGGGHVVVGYSNSNNADVNGNNGGEDVWVVRLSDSGDILWQDCFGGPGMDQGSSIEQTSDNGFIIAGTATYDGGDVSGMHSASYDAWVVKLGPEATSTAIINHDRRSFKLRPNPAQTTVVVEVDSDAREASIIDLAGHAIHTVPVRQEASVVQFDLSSVACGIYLMQVRLLNGTILTERFIIE
jgi:hypothetical protein